MADTSLQKRVPGKIAEKGQYLLAFGIIASMLLVAQIPLFVVFFFGVFAYLVLKMLATGSRSDTREIFEFYLTANEMLRDDDRRWFGFELTEAIHRGEEIVKRMSAAPPLVHFTLGALYHKAGDHKSAVKYLAEVMERDNGSEAAYVYPTPELRNYVKVLRKIEREPADAPLTSAAVRALERARRLRGSALLEESRVKFAHGLPPATAAEPEQQEETHSPEYFETLVPVSYSGDAEADRNEGRKRERADKAAPANGSKHSAPDDPYADRKPISEVLHDIYDKNVG
ncbi:MAG TPA: hypothetical protein VK918_08830 [Pyrinomonadaceae bacterium]|nr:hypothetical protein [Pyrinomonadaceae bacterium]